MKPQQLIKGLFTLVICVLAYSTVLAQTPTERAASGNAPSASASARIDMTNESVRRFIAGQEGLVTGVQTTVNSTNTSILARLGQMRDTLVNFNPAGGCDPALGPHGCACACGGPDQKLLWNGNAWQCYRAEQQCPRGSDGRPQVFNPETCQCETCTDCPILTCDPPLIAIGTGQTTSCGGEAGECACPSSMRRPGMGFDPELEAVLDSYSEDANGCPINARCMGGMDFRGRSCCCPGGQRFANGQCGDVCPAGYQDGSGWNGGGTPVGTFPVTSCSQFGFEWTNGTCHSQTSASNCDGPSPGEGYRCCRIETATAEPTEYGASTQICIP